MNNIITKTNAVLNSVGEAIHTTFGILFGGKTFIKSIPSYEEIIVMN
nr:MAG TPA: E protein [Caudoviricetes sp.]